MNRQKKEDALILNRMSWPEIKEEMDEELDTVLIPVGSTEQHGPNGSFGVDSGRAEGFVHKLAERLYPKAVAVPVISYGVAPHHMNFPGTITLKPETLMQVLQEVVDSLYQHGFRKFFFANGHGGNRPVMTLLMGRLKDKYPDITASWASFTSVASDVLKDNITSETHGHACEGEISQAMYLAPWTVKEDRQPGKIKISSDELDKSMARKRSINQAQTFDEITDNGALGDATKADWELGEQIVETALDRLEEYLRKF